MFKNSLNTAGIKTSCHHYPEHVMIFLLVSHFSYLRGVKGLKNISSLFIKQSTLRSIIVIE